MTHKQDLIDELLQIYNGDLSKISKDLSSRADAYKKVQKSKKDFSGAPIIARAVDVSKTFNPGKDNKVEALASVNVDIRQGEIAALVGPSGSGKSTLLNIFAGLDKPTDGKIEIDGQSLGEMTDNQLSTFRNNQIGFVFQFFYLQPFLDLQTNVEVPTMFNRTSPKERHDYSAKLIDAVGLGDRLKHLPKELSGGQMQRAAIARALINKPRLIIADEPTGNLDSANAQAIMDLFEDVRQKHGTAVLVVTHDKNIAKRADRVLTLKDGKVISS